jgi:hypothetical protein
MASIERKWTFDEVDRANRWLDAIEAAEDKAFKLAHPETK